MDAHCSQCGQTIRLAGRLASVTTIISRRHRNPAGIGLELLGFGCMFFVFPWGMIVGAAIVYAGWRKSNVLLCGNCGARVSSTALDKCPACKAGFTTD